MRSGCARVNGRSATTDATLSVVPSSASSPPRISSVVDAKNVEPFDRLARIDTSPMRTSRPTSMSIQSRRKRLMRLTRLGARAPFQSAKRV